MPEIPQERIDRAKELLAEARHVSMATVNLDGSPHNTPLFFIPDAHLKHIYWGSVERSLHSKNVLRTGKAFFALYDSHNVGGGLYLRCSNARVTQGEELNTALQTHNTRRAGFGRNPLSPEYYSQEDGQRMFMADIVEISINFALRDEDGHIIEDVRVPTNAGLLL